MVKNQKQDANLMLTLLRKILGMVILFGLMAFCYVVWQAMSGKKTVLEYNLSRFATHSLARLQVSSTPILQPTRIFYDAKAQEVSLSDFLGNYVLLNVWASWCAPCVAEMPSLDRLAQKHHANTQKPSLRVVTVSLDRHVDDAKKFFFFYVIENLTLYHDPSLGLATDVRVSGLPISIIYNPNGREIARIASEVDWQSPQAEALWQALLEE